MPYLVLIALVPGIVLFAPLSVFLPEDMEVSKMLAASLFLSAIFYLGCIVAGLGNPLPMFVGASGLVVTIYIRRVTGD